MRVASMIALLSFQSMASQRTSQFVPSLATLGFSP
jgi:hypothetical protein